MKDRALLSHEEQGGGIFEKKKGDLKEGRGAGNGGVEKEAALKKEGREPL